MLAASVNQTDPNDPLTIATPGVVDFCTACEEILNHGLKGTYNTKERNTTTAISFLGVVGHPLIRKQIPAATNCLTTVNALETLSPEAKGKAWLKLALNMGILSSSIEVIANNPDIYSYWYENHSLFCDREQIPVIVTLLFPVGDLRFALSLAEPSTPAPEDP
jgi:hypothetical protein